MSEKDHWERVYAAKPIENLGWYEPRLNIPLQWIKGIGLKPDAPIIDIGGGASTLVDDLLDMGYGSITVLDVSRRALSAVRARLAEKVEFKLCRAISTVKVNAGSLRLAAFP